MRDDGQLQTTDHRPRTADSGKAINERLAAAREIRLQTIQEEHLDSDCGPQAEGGISLDVWRMREEEKVEGRGSWVPWRRISALIPGPSPRTGEGSRAQRILALFPRSGGKGACRSMLRDEGRSRIKKLALIIVGGILLIGGFQIGTTGPAKTAAPTTAPMIEAASTLPTRSPLPSEPASPTITAEQLELSQATQVVLTAGVDQGDGLEGQDLESKRALTPLRFSFPPPPPAPVSAWRPPLYPIPWAISPYDHFYFTRPIAADEINWPLWDYRYGGLFFEGVVHTGIDITAPKGTPVLAAGAGKVIWAGYGLYRGGEDPSDPYGLAVAIHHDFGYQGQDLYTMYGHMDRIDVVVGQHVAVGQQLGLSGETGKVTGPHLHFEVRLGKNNYFATRNPELWLVPPQGWGVLVGRITDSAYQLKPGVDVIIQSVASGQNWLAKSYGKEAVNSDVYYQENLVVGDLPAGVYEIRIPYMGVDYRQKVQIQAGEISYFSFYGRDGFDLQLPEPPGVSYTP